MNKGRMVNNPRYRFLEKVWLNQDKLPLYKLSTRKFGPFKVISVDEEKKNYPLDISRFSFINKHQVHHVSAFEPF